MSLTDDYHFEVHCVKYQGQFTPGRKWLLTDFDTWESNPYYVNPKPWLVDDSHPDDDAPPPVRLAVVQCNAFAIARQACRDALSGDDQLPF